ncbi:AMIN domain-containing protein [Solemya velum gill symbiont]|uniref:AMIN domain-containing protein n=1 Tax=Solemya velum gill symbiont TaxID=2340 RepID=UPI000996479B|nr:AMIN domain-containing protein [Solemya velum gill symbiont]
MFARLLISLALLTSCFVSVPLLAGEQIKGVRSWSAPERTRLVFDTTGQVEHRIFSLDNPGRIVIDIKNCRLTDNSPTLIDNRFVKAMRSGVRDKSGIRLVPWLLIFMRKNRSAQKQVLTRLLHVSQKPRRRQKQRQRQKQKKPLQLQKLLKPRLSLPSQPGTWSLRLMPDTVVKIRAHAVNAVRVRKM